MKQIRKNAFWISPQAELFAVPSTHLDLIISYAHENPSIFGWTTEQIKKLFEANNESELYGFDCSQSREDIVADCIKRSWVRIRLYSHRPSSCWHIQVDELKQVANNIVKAFLKPMQKGKVSGIDCQSRNPPIMVINLQGEILYQANSVMETIKYLENI